MPQYCGMIMYVFIYCACFSYVVNCHMGLLKLRKHVCCVCVVVPETVAVQ